MYHGYGFDGGCGYPVGGYGYPVGGCGYPAYPVGGGCVGFGFGGFALIVVLFILLIIIGASWSY